MFVPTAGVFLAANATSLGWGLRGEWGHWWGATVPGALCGMALWAAFGETNSAWQMMAYGAAMAIGLSLGGVLSYGLIVGYATAEPGRRDRSTRFGLLGLFLVGGLWGFFGGTSLGLIITDVAYGMEDLSVWAIVASLGAFMAYKLLVLGLDLHLSPPRSDAWAALLGGAIATTAYFIIWAKDLTVLGNAFIGWLGFGGGFALGAFIHRRGDMAGWHFSSWKFMEHNVGFFGGLALGTSASMMEGGLPEVTLLDASRLSVLVVFWFMTYMVVSNNFEHWARDLHWISQRLLSLFHVVALASLPIFLLLAWNLSRNWGGTGIQGWVFAILMVAYTIIGTAKFVDRWSSIRSRVVATFVIQFIICIVLLMLV